MVVAAGTGVSLGTGVAGGNVAVGGGRVAVGAIAVGMIAVSEGTGEGAAVTTGPQAAKARVRMIRIGKITLFTILDAFFLIDSSIILPAKKGKWAVRGKQARY
jgi:hypothetical protein